MKGKLPTLHSKRLSLNKLTKSDWKEISYLRSDAKINKYVKRPPAETKEDALVFVEKIDSETRNGRMLYWKICLLEHQDMIGSICLWHFSNDGRVAEIGYDLDPAYQGKGYMTEAMETVLDYGFNELQLEDIEAYTQDNNLSSIHLLSRFGFKLVPDRRDESNAKNRVYNLNRLDAKCV